MPSEINPPLKLEQLAKSCKCCIMHPCSQMIQKTIQFSGEEFQWPIKYTVTFYIFSFGTIGPPALIIICLFGQVFCCILQPHCCPQGQTTKKWGQTMKKLQSWTTEHFFIFQCDFNTEISPKNATKHPVAQWYMITCKIMV